MGFGCQVRHPLFAVKAFRTLDIKAPACPPYNTTVQVIERSWRRSHWESRTVNAKIRCPSADTSRSLVVKTENGSLLTTGKVWQSAVKPKLKIEVDGEPIEAQRIVPEVPTHRVTGKSRVSALLYPQCPIPLASAPVQHSVKRLASDMVARSMFKCQRLALLVKAMPSSMFRTQRSIMAFEGDSFFTGSYVRGNIIGLSNHARDYPDVTAYLAAFLKERTSLPFASVGLVIGCNTAARKDVHNQVGTSNILLPVQLHHGILWIEDPSGRDAREVRPNTSRMGHVTHLSVDNLVSFNPKFYHQAHLSAGSIVLVGYTRVVSIISLCRIGLQWLPYMPATSTEFLVVG